MEEYLMNTPIATRFVDGDIPELLTLKDCKALNLFKFFIE